MVRLGVQLGTLVLLMAAPVRPAQAQDPAEAEATALAYVEAVAVGEWDTAAALTDPDDIARLDALVAFLMEDEVIWTALLAITAETISSEDSFKVLMALALTGNPEMAKARASARFEVVGSVPEGDSLVHVVARTRMMFYEHALEAVDVTTVRWTGDRWVVRLDEQAEAMLLELQAVQEDPERIEDFDGELLTPRDPKKQ
ncbi:MAG: hypothetical protein AAGI52_18795 [Bacteroidota bacterium]